MAIKELDKVIASRIAAGEVVDKPSSVLRELMDNSIDAGAHKIAVYLEEGGIKSLMVSDDGEGFEKEDLKIACKSHATSKIKTLDDLFNLRTLGFRGEALNSICSVSKLTISSNGWSIVNDNGYQSEILPSSVAKGTQIISENLFDNIPARKQFLKRPSSEASDCKKVFIEKALGFEAITFELHIDGNLDMKLEATTKKQRVLDVMSLDRSFVNADSLEMSYEAEPIRLYAVCSNPGCYRRDRGQIRIFVNNRIIDNYALVQAIVNAYSVMLPGGAYPFFYLFIEDSPSLVDFNIHPTKRECRMRNQSTVYGVLTKMIRDSLLEFQKKNLGMEIKSGNNKTETAEDTEKQTLNELFDQKEPEYCVKDKKIEFSKDWFESARKIISKTESKQEKTQSYNFSYIGRVFDTFLIAEKDGAVYFIDQHAAHERLLYDEISSLKDVQQLIVPYRFETDSSTDLFLDENSVVYQELGIELVKSEPLVWEMVSIPAACRKSEKYIADFISKTAGDVESVKKGLFAVIACHAAIKAGDSIDDNTACKLIEKAFELDAMLCPHGRSFTWSVSKEELYKIVGRTL